MASVSELRQKIAEQERLEARELQLFALVGSPTDLLKFTCSNPPYSALLVLELPRSVWGPIVQKELTDATGVLTEMQASADAYVAVEAKPAALTKL